MALAEGARKAAPLDPRNAIESIPRAYNFAADVLERNLAAGRASQPAYVDPRGAWTYAALAERAARFGDVLVRLESVARSASCLRYWTRSTGPPPSSAPSKPE